MTTRKLKTTFDTTTRPTFGRTVAGSVALVLFTSLGGCGYSEEEMQAQLDKYNKLAAETQAEKDARAKAEAELDETRLRVAEAKRKLKEMGMNLDDLSSKVAADATEKERMAQNLEQLQAALEEYKKRAAQLERIQARFLELQQKLQKLVNLGLKVEIRHNRMVIRLPGDVLFDSGKTKLKDEGKEVIGAVADVIRKDEGLASRYFQIAGHTDDRPVKGGPFLDNWGLSAMRAREVLLFLVQPTGSGGGGLSALKLHPAGYADTDPVAGNDTIEGRQANRRVELVVVPDMSEMLDITQAAGGETPKVADPAKTAPKPADKPASKKPG